MQRISFHTILYFAILLLVFVLSVTVECQRATATPTPDSGSSSSSNQDLTAGQTAGGIIGFIITCILVLLCIICMGFFFLKWVVLTIKKKLIKK